MEKDTLKTLEALTRGGVTIGGDLVLEKHVEYEVNNVEDGGIGIQINNTSKKAAGIKPDNNKGPARPMNETLMIDEAQALKSKLVEAGMLTDDWQPVGLSGTEKGVLAMKIAERLNIRNVWQQFGALWGMKPETLRASFNKAQEQKKNLEFQEKIKNILG